jgi:hypothetical protein
VLNLSSTSSLLQVVTGSGVNSIVVHVSFVDLEGTTVTPGEQNTIITTATTTTIVPAPGATTDRNVKFISVQNTSGADCQVAIQHTDGVNVVDLFNIDLLAGYTIQYNTDGSGFVCYDNDGRILVTGPTINLGTLAISASGSSASSGTVVFSNSNGVSFGMAGSTVTASVNVSALDLAAIAAGTQIATSGTVAFADANGVSFGMIASSLVTASILSSLSNINVSAGTTSNNLSAITFANGGGVTFGLNASTITASVATGLSNINVSAGTTSNNLSAITFANSNGVSFGLNASTLTASVDVAVGTVSVFSQDADFVTNFQMGQASLSLQKLSIPMNISATQLAIIANISGSSNITDAVTISHAVYTLSAGTASLASSGSRLVSWITGSLTNLSFVYGGVSGTRYRTISVSYAMTPGDYIFAWWLSTANGASVSVFGRAAMNIVGTFDGVETATFVNGMSASSVAAFPTSFAATNTNYVRTGVSAMRQPGAILFGTN